MLLLNLKRYTILLIIGLTAFFAISGGLVKADDYGLDVTAENAGIKIKDVPNKDVYTIVGNVISVALGLLGVIFLCLTIYGGFMWMTASGNSETVTKAKDMITNATIGLAVILAAYSIVYFVTEQLATKM